MPSSKESHFQKIVVIIPTYNEAGNVTPLLTHLFALPITLNVLFVDDNSQDGTCEQISAAQLVYPERVHLIKRAGKLGLGSAYIEGIKWSLEHNYEVCVQMDADFSHDPKFLPAMLKQLETADVVLGSRYICGGEVVNWTWSRRLISRFGSLYARLILGMRVHDMTGGFNAWKANVLRTIDLESIRSEGYAFQIEMKYVATRAGFKLAEVPIRFEDRRVGKSKMSLAIALEAIWRVWSFRF
jgi:dolichol-phosphate mannosyltransferase